MSPRPDLWMIKIRREAAEDLARRHGARTAREYAPAVHYVRSQAEADERVTRLRELGVTEGVIVTMQPGDGQHVTLGSVVEWVEASDEAVQAYARHEGIPIDEARVELEEMLADASPGSGEGTGPATDVWRLRRHSIGLDITARVQMHAFERDDGTRSQIGHVASIAIRAYKPSAPPKLRANKKPRDRR